MANYFAHTTRDHLFSYDVVHDIIVVYHITAYDVGSFDIIGSDLSYNIGSFDLIGRHLS